MSSLIIRFLTAFAILLFIGSAFSELKTDELIPEKLRIAKEEVLSIPNPIGVVGVLFGLGSLPVALIGYIGCFLLRRWGAYLLLLHILMFVFSNLLLGLHLYTGITQALFLAYTFVGGVVFALVLAKNNKTKICEQTDPANRHPSGTSGMAPADPASRAGAMPEASGDS